MGRSIARSRRFCRAVPSSGDRSWYDRACDINAMISRALSWLLEPFGFGRRRSAATRFDFRFEKKSKAAVVFVHGFTGDARDTWSTMADHVLTEPKLATWDVFGLGFSTSLRIDVPEVWAADADLTLIARQLNTTLSLSPFSSYDVLAIAAHSMGGLVVQRALLDDVDLTARISNVFMFGTPSGGLPKARIVTRIKRQFRDMSPDSHFIRNLRSDWSAKFGDSLPFKLHVIAGERDEFVPSSSSLKPFPSLVQAAVPGNHAEIVRPSTATHQSVRIIVESLMGGRRALPPLDSARLAVELGQYRRAIEVLMPQASCLDDNAIVSLALALESTGRTEEALAILEAFHRGGSSSTEALGTLAGRLKRRWLASRAASDYQMALELYERGLDQAEACNDSNQAFYHAINVAFLTLMRLAPHSPVTADCMNMASRALVHCRNCDIDHWRLATEGEALLILGKLDDGIDMYQRAISSTRSQREIDSMYSQALRIAERVYGEEGLLKIEQVFGLHK